MSSETRRTMPGEDEEFSLGFVLVTVYSVLVTVILAFAMFMMKVTHIYFPDLFGHALVFSGAVLVGMIVQMIVRYRRKSLSARGF